MGRGWEGRGEGRKEEEGKEEERRGQPYLEQNDQQPLEVTRGISCYVLLQVMVIL